MKKFTKFLSMALALVMVVSMLSACGGENQNTDVGGNGEPKYGGHLNIRIATIATGLDPLKQTGVWKYLWTSCVFEGAVTRDAENNICPGVCDFELSEDNLTLKLKVREGENFSNGDLVDIEDVKASYQRGFDLYKNITKYVVPYVKSMEIEGDTLVIQFTEYHEKCFHYLCSWQTWCPVMPKEICEKYATDYITDQIEDAIGTGPYKVVDFKGDVSVTIERREGYVPYEAGHDGYASQKMAYLDSMTFWTNTNDSTAALAALSGEYDVVEVLPKEYLAQAEQQGLVKEVLASNVGCTMLFNTTGTNNICAKYPSLRKAIMAAIDYPDFVETITDGGGKLEGSPVVGKEYETTIFTDADYYGEQNLEVAAKYLEEAKKEGYDGTPVQIVYENSRNDVPTLLNQYLDDAGIDNEVTIMETNAFQSFRNDPNNNWDFRFEWPTYSFTPTEMPVAIIETNYKSETKDALLKEMEKLNPTSEEYLAKWTELANLMVDECCTAHMGIIDWFWFHQATFHSNDTGVDRYIFNAYWDDPENHTRN